MLLAIDVGNTTINMGIFKNANLIWQKKIATSQEYSLKNLLMNKPITAVIISSVVPKVTITLKKIFNKQFHIRPFVLGEDMTVPIKNLYKNPKQVGQDRLVNAYAGYKKFGGGLIIVDFGTAVTFDIISRKGEYSGGIIVPGIETALTALSEKAALLGAVGDRVLQKCRGSIYRTRNCIGRDTLASMLSGILHGYGALCDGLIAKIKKEVGADYKVILTGGHAKIISGYCHYDTIQPNLTLEGLNRIFQVRINFP